MNSVAPISAPSTAGGKESRQTQSSYIGSQIRRADLRKKRGAARQAAERVNFAEVANIPLPGRQASEDEVKASVQMLVRR